MNITHLVTKLIFTIFLSSSLFGMDNNMPFSIENKPSVKQNDGWQCGYFTAFHVCTYHKWFTKNGNLNSCKLNKDDYQSWLNNIKNNIQIDSIRQDKMPLKEKYKLKKWLDNDDVIAIIRVMANTNTSTHLPDNITYINKKELEQIPLSLQTYKSIENYKKDRSPQFAVLNISDNHWFLAITNHYGLDIIDSLYKHTDNELLLEKLYSLYHDKFPTLSQKQAITKYLKSSEAMQTKTFDEKKDLAQKFVTENHIEITEHHLHELVKRNHINGVPHETIELECSDEEQSPIKSPTPQTPGCFGSLKKAVLNIGIKLLNYLSYWNKK